MERHELTRVKLLDAQVCSEGTWDEALDFIRREHPAGTSGNWNKNERENFQPVDCAQHPGRKHYMFEC